MTPLPDATARLAAAAEALEQTIARINASHDSLHAKIDRIIAAIDDRAVSASSEQTDGGAPPSLARLSRARVGIDADASHNAPTNGVPGSNNATRKTLTPFASLILSKSGADESISADSAVLDKALASLSVEQRVAVKAEMARAGLIS